MRDDNCQDLNKQNNNVQLNNRIKSKYTFVEYVYLTEKLWENYFLKTIFY